MSNKKQISLAASAFPVLFLMGSLFYGVQIAKIDVHLPIFISGMVAAVVAKLAGNVSWDEVEEGVIHTIGMSMQAILILLIIGMVIGTWILSGVVPTMIYYGLKIINPAAFLPITLISCSIVSLALGSSWTTASTIGVALIGIGEGFGIDRNIIAGAVISGSYFGDKMSPLSDTTNLAPAMAGATLFDHIKHMLYTTMPAYIISLALFTFIGVSGKTAMSNQETIETVLNVMSTNFVISPWLLLIPVLLIIVILMKVPAIPGLFLGAAFGGVGAILVQGKNFGEVMTSLHYGYEGDSGLEMVDKLFNRGGMDSMMWTISLIMCAMVFGGIMEKSGMLEVLANSVLRFATSTGKLIAATVLTPIFLNTVAGDQYLAIVIPGRMFRGEFEKRGLAPKNLSRCLEDSGTMTSSLIPWNTCGATMIGALGLQPWAYVPYCFLNILCPIVSMIYGFTGWTIEKIKPCDETVAN